MSEPDPILVVSDLNVSLASGKRMTPILREVSFALRPGEILGIVGESGSGKSLTASAIMGLLEPPVRIVSGAVAFKGRDLAALDEKAVRAIRGNEIAMVFQDPAMSLNPLLRIETQMVESIVAHDRGCSRHAARERARAALETVGVPAAAKRLRAYPHELSGGMRQRVSIAIAMLHSPAVIIADEPTTALDVTIQAQILDEMTQLCRKNGTALIWISHDLSLLSSFADRICVMYAGRVIESGPCGEVIGAPRHPYSRGLILSVPAMARAGKDIEPIPGYPPRVGMVPSGCAFRPRCHRASPACAVQPPLQTVASQQSAACFHPFDDKLQVPA
ncbi:peptide/nickel transport system ATP-binding protein [Chelatococcus asaccharovorans]|uniref:Peptide/nickel transport system ATP-binding protein n=1 Tax=Chelatococcus asaccharovorans TaxID=28210 RepID=A0A2V3U5X9_9HYPH|nr:ABC transporter ATP-binding protein [Chelatococcus asaccharovorans]MBS7703740.1 ABC transporter ATP-binding protein [Chelatococcus asaccharovorans]PXW57898.1 peptide/nickel transport system ATP-binding protein [Chelatococcus asaccharovorans]